MVVVQHSTIWGWNFKKIKRNKSGSECQLAPNSQPKKWISYSSEVEQKAYKITSIIRKQNLRAKWDFEFIHWKIL